MKSLVSLLTWVLLWSAPLQAAPGAGSREVGLSVGQPAPDFRLLDQSGKTVSLAEMLKKGPVALVFFRSADW
ncbi:MAG: redoxin domain-containing protein [Verrucomicrobia bacterium]|nr:redoxin domain-containing protein [Verrucomicrobiota bacterium]